MLLQHAGFGDMLQHKTDAGKWKLPRGKTMPRGRNRTDSLRAVIHLATGEHLTAGVDNAHAPLAEPLRQQTLA